MIRFLIILFLALALAQCTGTGGNTITDGEGDLDLGSAPVAVLPLPSQDDGDTADGSSGFESGDTITGSDVGGEAPSTEKIGGEGGDISSSNPAGGEADGHFLYAAVNTSKLLFSAPDSANNSVLITQTTEENSDQTFLIETEYVEADSGTATLTDGRQKKNDILDIFRHIFSPNAMATPDLSICEEKDKTCLKLDEKGSTPFHVIPLDGDLLSQGYKAIFYVSYINTETGEIGPETPEEISTKVTFVSSIPAGDNAMSVRNDHDEWFFATESGIVKKVNYRNNIFTVASGSIDDDYSLGRIELPSPSNTVQAFELIDKKNQFLFLLNDQLLLTEDGSVSEAEKKYKPTVNSRSSCHKNCWPTDFKVRAAADNSTNIYYSTATLHKPETLGALINLYNGQEKPIVFNFFDRDLEDDKQLMHIRTYDFVLLSDDAAAITARMATASDSTVQKYPGMDVLADELPDAILENGENTDAYDFSTYFIVSATVKGKKIKEPITGSMLPNYQNYRIKLPEEWIEVSKMQIISNACTHSEADCWVSFIANGAIHFTRFNNPYSTSMAAEVVHSINVGKSTQGVVWHDNTQTLFILDNERDGINPDGKIFVISTKDINTTKPQIVRTVNIADDILNDKNINLSPSGLKLYTATDGSERLLITAKEILSLISLEIPATLTE